MMQSSPGLNGQSSSAAMLRRYSKLQSACAALQEAAKIVEENALSAEEIAQLSNSNIELDRAIADSPTVLVSKYIKEEHHGIQKAFRHYKFEEGAPNVNSVVKYPVVSSAYLEKLAFMHRSWSSMNIRVTEVDRAVATNERLEFLGDSWLGAFVSYILYKKYPYANEGSLSKMRSAIVNNVNLARWCQKVGFDERLQDNIPKMVNKLKDVTYKYHADCFEAYVGALVVDKYAVEFDEIVSWIESLSGDVFDYMGAEMIKNPMNKNAKNELATLLSCNKVGAKLEYHRLNAVTPFKVEVKIGDVSLATGEGSTIREAEQRAAMKALLDTSKIKAYSLYQLDDRLIEDLEMADAAGNPSRDSIQSTRTSETDNSANEQSEPVSSKPSQETTEKISVEEAVKGGVSRTGSVNGQSTSIPDTQVSDIVEQILNRLKDTVLTSVAAVMQENGLSGREASIPQVAKFPPALTQNVQATPKQSYSHFPTSAANFISDKQAPAPSLVKLENPASFVPSGRIINSSHLNSSVAEHSSSVLPDFSSRGSATQPHLAHQAFPTMIEKSGAEMAPQHDIHPDQFQIDASSKQELYAFLGQRGFRPIYETKAAGLQSYSSDCMVQGFNVVLGSGLASSKKQAEQIAAFYSLRGESIKSFLDYPAAYANTQD